MIYRYSLSFGKVQVQLKGAENEMLRSASKLNSLSLLFIVIMIILHIVRESNYFSSVITEG